MPRAAVKAIRLFMFYALNMFTPKYDIFWGESGLSIIRGWGVVSIGGVADTCAEKILLVSMGGGEGGVR